MMVTSISVPLVLGTQYIEGVWRAEAVTEILPSRQQKSMTATDYHGWGTEDVDSLLKSVPTPHVGGFVE